MAVCKTCGQVIKNAKASRGMKKAVKGFQKDIGVKKSGRGKKVAAGAAVGGAGGAFAAKKRQKKSK